MEKVNNSIILDNFSFSSSNGLRFRNGMHITFIATNDSVLNSEHTYNYTKYLCCSPVKNTLNNWFYVVPQIGNNRKFLETWIKEISPMFPTLDIKLVRSTAKVADTNINHGVNAYHPICDVNKQGNTIKVNLGMSIASNTHYIVTNRINYEEGSFSKLHFLIKLFIDYCLENKIKLTSDSYEEVVNNFVSNNIFNIKEEFGRPYHVAVSVGTDTYIVDSSLCIERDTVTVEKIIIYLSTLIDNNLDSVIDCVERVLNSDTKEEEGNLYIQALYSKKAYSVEAYLAHHLIRAGLSGDFRDFIEQYFTIKKALPNEYFWNIIFLTQFGFDFYYYYWITHERTFKFTTPQEFNKKAREFSDTSTLSFFRLFYIEHGTTVKNMIKKLYKEGNFVAISNMLGTSIKIVVKESRKTRMTNLRIAEHYVVLMSDDKYYHIKGDDFRMHKYLKTNFDLLPV